MPDMIFETTRLLVRRWRGDDAAAALDLYSRPEVLEFLGSAARRTTLQEASERIAAIVERDRQWDGPNGRRRMGAWAIVEKATGRVIGCALLKPLPNDTRVEVGWHLLPERWGHGFATEAGAGAIRHGFDHAGLDVIYAVVDPANTRSSAVCRRLGMTSLGTTDRYYDLELELYEQRRPSAP